MRLEHVRDASMMLADKFGHPVDVSLWVNNDRRITVDHHVAAVTQTRRLDDFYPHTFTVTRAHELLA